MAVLRTFDQRRLCGKAVTGLGLAITIIGIPFAWAHLKMIPLAVWPVGQTIVTAEEAELLRGVR